MLAALFVVGLAATAAVPADAATPKNGYLVFSQEHTTMMTQSPGAGSYVYLARGSNPKYSPDGKQLAYFRDEVPPGADYFVEKLWVRDLARGTETQVAVFSPEFADRTLTWAPDGASIVYNEEMSLHRVVVATGAHTVIWASGSRTADQPAYAPDGSRIAFVSGLYGINPSEPAIMTVKPDGTGLHTVMAGGTDFYNEYPDWSPDSSKIAFVTNKYDHAHNEIVTLPRNGSGTPFRVSHLSHPTTHELAGVAWSPNGNKIAGLEAYPEYLPGDGPFDERRVVRGYAPDGSSSAPLTGPITGDGTGNPPGLDWAPKVS
jgi:Tol biopolymer transport system component